MITRVTGFPIVVLACVVAGAGLTAADVTGRWRDSRDGLYIIRSEGENTTLALPSGHVLTGTYRDGHLEVKMAYQPGLVSELDEAPEEVRVALQDEGDGIRYMAELDPDAKRLSGRIMFPSWREAEDGTITFVDPSSWRSLPLTLRRDERTTVAPRAIGIDTDWISVFGGPFPEELPSGYVTIDDLDVVGAGRADPGNSREVRVTIRHPEGFRPGAKTVRVDGRALDDKLTVYQVGIDVVPPDEQPAEAVEDDRGREVVLIPGNEMWHLRARVKPVAEFTVVWDFTSDVDPDTPIDWETAAEPPEPVGEVTFEEVEGEARIRGLRKGLVKATAYITVSPEVEAVPLTATKDLLIEDDTDDLPRIRGVVPAFLCPTGGEQRLYLYGDNIEDVDVDPDALGPGVIVRDVREGARSETVVQLAVVYRAPVEGETMRDLVLRAPGDTRVVVSGAVRLGREPRQSAFFNAFDWTGTRGGPPASLNDLIDRMLPANLPRGIERLFPDERDLVAELSALVNGGNEQGDRSLLTLRAQFDRATSIVARNHRALSDESEEGRMARTAVWPDLAASLFGQQLLGLNDRPNPAAVGNFFGARAASAECEFRTRVAALEEALSNRIDDYIMRYDARGEVQFDVENMLGLLVMAGALDLEQAQDILNAAINALRTNAVIPPTMLGVLAHVAPGLAQQLGPQFGVHAALTLLGSAAVKSVVQRLWSTLRAGRGLTEVVAQRNLLNLARVGASVELLEGMERWATPADIRRLVRGVNPDARRGLLRLAGSDADARFARRLAEDLGDDAPRFFSYLDLIYEKGRRARVTADGLRRYERYLGRHLNVDDLRALERSWSHRPGTTIDGQLAEIAAIRRWQRSRQFRSARDLNMARITMRYGRHMPVVDALVWERGDRRRFVSIASGSLDYSLSKFERLVGISQPENHRTMLNILRREFNVRNADDFMKRAQLRVPPEHVQPLRFVISARFDDPAMQSLRRRFDLKLADLVEMIQPLPTGR